MMKRHLMLAMAAVMISASQMHAVPGPGNKVYKDAVRLYRNGMYERARTLFESVSQQTGDVLSEGYSVLCAAKMKKPGYEEMMEAFLADHPETILDGQLHFQKGTDLFDKEDYAAAKSELSMIPKNSLSKTQVAEYMFKRAYCDFALGDYAAAREKFTDVEKMPFSDFTAPSRYAIGYIDYSNNEFNSAIDWFSLSVKDPRFADHSNYYLLECRFMNKDYSYVIQNGPQMFETIPVERQPHLARIISESYLVLGNVDQAKDFYEKSTASTEDRTRSDYFYAGSMLYAVKDYEGAIENFNNMSFRTDSLGQIASYELGNAYIQTKNKVAAMNSFKEAASLAFDSEIQEDAMFNYAKLAFDLNQDGVPFADYISRYAKSKRGDDIYSYMALSKLVARDYAGAVEAYDMIDELSPDMRSNYMKANYLRANQLIANGSWRDAAQCLQAASFYTSKRDPFNQLSRYWLAESYYNSGKYEDAQKVLTELYNNSALEGRPEGNAIPYNLAYSYFKQEDYANAAKWFDNVISSGDRDYAKDASVRRADCDFARKEYKTAAALYGNVLEKYGDADDIYPYYQQGLAYGLAGDRKMKAQALSRVKSASVSSPLYSEAMYELGRAYVELKDEKSASECFETLRTNSKDYSFVARSLIELGMISRNGKDYDKALGYYKQVIETLPKNEYSEDAMLAIESIYQAKGEPETYIAYAQAVGAGGVKSEAEVEEIYFNSAEQVFLNGNYQKALASIQKYKEAYPSGSKLTTVLFYEAESYRALGQKEEAAESYAKVITRADAGDMMEPSAMGYASVSYGLEHYQEAYNGYRILKENARLEDNVHAAALGMMRSAYRARMFNDAVSAAETVKSDPKSNEAEIREADYTKAKSYLASSRRDEAFAVLEKLAQSPSTDEGAEAAFMMIQDRYDKGQFSGIEEMVYSFSGKAQGQNYWLAKAFIVLGDTFAETDNLAQAKATFESVRDGYEPQNDDDDVLDNVRMRLEKLESLMK